VTAGAEPEIRVWRFSLRPPPDTRQRCFDALDDPERARAARFRFERDRDAYVVARGALRLLLARLLDRPAGRIAFHYNEYGKPFLAGDAGGGLQFNLSHAHDLGLIAVTDHRPVGVDLEYLGRELELESVARRFFTGNEARAILEATGSERTRRFFSCWTRKEAYIKARGTGMTTRLDRFEVSVPPAQPVAVRWIGPEPSPAPCCLFDLDVGPDYAAAAAAADSSGGVARLLDWPDLAADPLASS
jgi:4'-phosphopantetheinyl transferase